MARYLIKVTHLDGDWAGHTYYLQKGGHVTSSTSYQFADCTYSSYGMAMRQCKRLAEQNELDWKVESSNRLWRIRHGYPIRESRVFDHESYEPYEVTYGEGV